MFSTATRSLLSGKSRIALAGAAAAVALTLVSCDQNQDKMGLFPIAIEGVPGIIDLGELQPAPFGDKDALSAAVIYGEVGPSGTSLNGGITFTFQGVGGKVCVLVDPETAYWNESVSPAKPAPGYQFPDNVYDDGDIDIDVGQSLYYTGTPGERIGTFEVQYEDTLGNIVPIRLSECLITGQFNASGNHAGRGAPEYCTVGSTIPGVSYTVAMEVQSVPVDDMRLSYGLLLVQGDCNDVVRTLTGQTSGGGGLGGGGAISSPAMAECAIRGESLIPGREPGAQAAQAGLEGRFWLAGEQPTWPDATNFEDQFCAQSPATYCRQELKAEREGSLDCSWHEAPNGDLEAGEIPSRCFCGDDSQSPTGGAF